MKNEVNNSGVPKTVINCSRTKILGEARKVL